MSTVLKQLETFKNMGMYAVTLSYGEDVGCDDLDIPVDERRIRLMGVPVGCMGEARVIYSGTTEDFQNNNFLSMGCKMVSNPPTPEEVSLMNNAKGEFFGFGTEGGIGAINRIFNMNKNNG